MAQWKNNGNLSAMTPRVAKVSWSVKPYRVPKGSIHVSPSWIFSTGENSDPAITIKAIGHQWYRSAPLHEDLEGIDEDPIKHKEIVDEVRDASETWGFFQVVKNGIPTSVWEEMLQGTREFFEQDVEAKKQYYTRDTTKRVIDTSNFDLYSPSVPAANWGDTLFCLMAPDPPSPKELPTACGRSWSQSLPSQGYGLRGGARYFGTLLSSIPQPELEIGTNKHSDNDFITVLLQDPIGGLQVLHQNQWVNVPPTPAG
ncbi:hypothetical protein MTR67_038259 [Solanum verrucosum]|uniref:Uncharacterized protein n=2 Tax=Solanum verrucosum TaxID=315347 RepID=A0AAF0UFG9_SOLVR|nr:hypothetical protein MTR67_038257 [Solanum verrucosum]WMV44874.1 hypothetical protein MTR67_038259 [Solanum verrucosum]